MLPLPSDFSVAPSHRYRLFTSPMFLLLLFLTLAHLATFIPAHISQKNYQAKSNEFHVLWNSGGAMALAQQGIDPNRLEESQRRHAYLATYVEKSIFYKIWIVPTWASVSTILFAWLLQPGWLSLLLSVWVLLYAGSWLESNWNRKYPALIVIGASWVAGLFYMILMSTFVDRYPELPFCGISAGVATMVGLIAKRHQEPVPMWTWWKGSRRFSIHPYTFVAVWFVLDFLVQVIINPLNYGWAFLFDLLAVGTAFGLAKNMHFVSKRTTTRVPIIDSSTQARKKIQECWRLVELLELESALHEIDQAVHILFKASQTDKVLLEDTFHRIFNAPTTLPIAPSQWYEWGSLLIDKHMPIPAITCLENALKSPSVPTEMARSAAVQATELRITHKLLPAQNRPWLERVLKLRNDDLIGRRAAKLLEQIG